MTILRGMSLQAPIHFNVHYELFLSETYLPFENNANIVQNFICV